MNDNLSQINELFKIENTLHNACETIYRLVNSPNVKGRLHYKTEMNIANLFTEGVEVIDNINFLIINTKFIDEDTLLNVKAEAAFLHTSAHFCSQSTG